MALFWPEKWCIVGGAMSKSFNGNGNGAGQGKVVPALKKSSPKPPGPAVLTAAQFKKSRVVFRSAEGDELHGRLTHFTRQSATFEFYGGGGSFRTSEILAGFQISVRDRVVYSGTAVIREIIDVGSLSVCEAKLNQPDWKSPSGVINENYQAGDIGKEFASFLKDWQGAFQVLPEFKVAIGDLQSILIDLRLWLDGLELELQSQPAATRARIEALLIDDIRVPVITTVGTLLEKFELVAQRVEPESRAAHIAYMQHHIHPFVLSSPFIHRTFAKPLGYAGDYEMVSMMVRDPHEGNTLFAKILNYIFLSTPPVQAHRDRLTYLTKMLRDETLRIRNLRKNQPVRIFNLGCGPAKEIQDFLAQHEISDYAQFSLLDFNEETLASTGEVLENCKRKHNRRTRVEMRKKSVQQILKDAPKMRSSPEKYDIVYCAGLFDYLTDTVCARLLEVFYDLTAPGGLVVATNVADINPSQGWMDYMLEWHLIYRSTSEFAAMAPPQASPDMSIVRAVGTGVNIVLETRKP